MNLKVQPASALEPVLLLSDAQQFGILWVLQRMTFYWCHVAGSAAVHLIGCARRQDTPVDAVAGARDRVAQTLRALLKNIDAQQRLLVALEARAHKKPAFVLKGTAWRV
jgi:hypothetical protein